MRLLTQRQSAGKVVTGWLPEDARLAMAFGSMSGYFLSPLATGHRSWQFSFTRQTTTAPTGKSNGYETAGFEPVKIGGVEQSGRLEVGGDLHDLVIGPAQARSLIGGT